MLIFYLAMIDSPEDKAKFEHVYLTYQKLMKLVALNILHDDFLAEDAVQQAFLQLIPNLGKIGEVDCHQTKNYMLIMVRRVCFAFYREQKKIIQIPLENLGEADLEEPEDMVSLHMEHSELLRKIDALPDIYADALYLMYCEDYATKEIADILGISVSAVKKRLERARDQLKILLLKEEGVNA